MKRRGQEKSKLFFFHPLLSPIFRRFHMTKEKPNFLTNARLLIHYSIQAIYNGYIHTATNTIKWTFPTQEKSWSFTWYPPELFGFSPFFTYYYSNSNRPTSSYITGRGVTKNESSKIWKNISLERNKPKGGHTQVKLLINSMRSHP